MAPPPPTFHPNSTPFAPSVTMSTPAPTNAAPTVPGLPMAINAVAVTAPHPLIGGWWATTSTFPAIQNMICPLYLLLAPTVEATDLEEGVMSEDF
ncbi:hypothetical protein GGX14DRAFT_561873 [Mycena pura]|uniref:Uncharacterized protein n=1 Tax=Mycena pura TaxID=153505 RepID=A0AAD6VQ40_9AGAR|nr:hypothetical protein GGX14DRAFT_561873 [Mycena pura]